MMKFWPKRKKTFTQSCGGISLLHTATSVPQMKYRKPIANLSFFSG